MWASERSEQERLAGLVRLLGISALVNSRAVNRPAFLRLLWRDEPVDGLVLRGLE